MNKLRRFADALATKGLTLDDARNIRSLSRDQADHVKRAYAHMNEPTIFEKSYVHVLGWFDIPGLPSPPDLRLRPGERIDDPALATVFAGAMRARLRLAEQHHPDPFTLATKKQDGVLWAVMYTLGYMRRQAWQRELQKDPMTTMEFDAWAASP